MSSWMKITWLLGPDWTEELESKRTGLSPADAFSD